jgi:pimeloyl-ACP methyl ester carboxylesterase
MISGSAQDFKLMLDYLPAYLPQFTRLHNIMGGVSLGGHTAWRMATMAAATHGQIKGFAMVVGCPNLTSLLLGRLGIDAASLGCKLEELDTVSYDRLEKVMNEEQKRRWPRALADMIRGEDAKVYKDFPSNVPLLLCNGFQDRLVPAFYTAAWLEKRRLLPPDGKKKEDNVHFFVQKNTGHSCTKEMVALIATWLGGIFEAET